jgi:hypothetical protein
MLRLSQVFISIAELIISALADDSDRNTHPLPVSAASRSFGGAQPGEQVQSFGGIGSKPLLVQVIQ